MNERKVLVSTDIGSDTDDALAILAMLNQGINLQGIYTVNGDVRTRAFIAKHLVNLAGKDIEISAGESESIGGEVRPHKHQEESYVDDKFVDDEETMFAKGKIIYKPLEDFRISSNGVEDLARKLSSGKHDIFNIGPMTNIARLIERYPQAVANINRLYVMAGRFLEEENLSEHNVRFDIPAAQLVFASQIPIIVIPGELCWKYRMPTKNLEQLTTPAGKYVKRMAIGNVAAETATHFCINNLEDEVEKQVSYSTHFVRDSSNNKLPVGQFKHLLTVNLNDPSNASFDPEGYFAQYKRLVEHLRDPAFSYRQGPIIASIMEQFIPQDISVADAYIPFVYSNPDKVKTTKGVVRVDNNGFSFLDKGDKHTIVTDLDFNEFREYLSTSLR